MAFGQGVVVTGGLPVLPCGAMRGNRDNCSYSTTALFVALISTYTLMHGVVCHLCFAFSLTLPHSPAVGKVGKPRWGHPLVEFVIVGKISRKKKIGPGCVVARLVHDRAFTHALKGRPRVVRTV